MGLPMFFELGETLFWGSCIDPHCHEGAVDGVHAQGVVDHLPVPDEAAMELASARQRPGPLAAMLIKYMCCHGGVVCRLLSSIQYEKQIKKKICLLSEGKKQCEFFFRVIGG